jgi:hypothetical protein
MDFREVRVAMSREGGAMMTTDDVLASLIHFWRQHQKLPLPAKAVPIEERR